MQPVYVFAIWQVKEGHLQQVLALLPGLKQQCTTEEGNLFYNIYQSLSDDHTLLLYEGYKNEAALDTHRGAAHFKDIVISKIVPLLDNREVVLAHDIQ